MFRGVQSYLWKGKCEKLSQLREIQGRISSIKSTKQITHAMRMISAVKLRKAQERIINLRPYADGIVSTIVDVASSYKITHPLLETKTEKKRPLLVLLSSDRGLCGNFNYSVCRKTEKYLKENKNHDLFVIGKKAVDYFKFRNIHPVDQMYGLDREISFPLAARISEFLMDSFVKGNYDEIQIIYQTFHSAVSQSIKVESFLPIDLSASTWGESIFSKDLIFEVTPKELLESLIKKHFSTQVYRAMCESLASEHGARMCAMENATKNAGEIIDKLQLSYNKMRQSLITTELIEVTSGAEAMNG